MAFGFPWAYYKEKIETLGDKETAARPYCGPLRLWDGNPR